MSRMMLALALLLFFMLYSMSIIYPQTVYSKIWQLDNIESIGGHNTIVLSEPQVVESPKGFAVQFDGIDDGLLIDSNPMEEVSSEFTIEVIFKPYASYPENVAQRFLHIQKPENDTRRVLIELRLTEDNMWYLDTFIATEKSKLALMDKKFSHPVGEWYHAALVYDNGIMKHYVDGIEELSGNVKFHMIENAKTSIGTRMDKRSWFKGAIQLVKVTNNALRPRQFIHYE